MPEGNEQAAVRKTHTFLFTCSRKGLERKRGKEMRTKEFNRFKMNINTSYELVLCKEPPLQNREQQHSFLRCILQQLHLNFVCNSLFFSANVCVCVSLVKFLEHDAKHIMSLIRHFYCDLFRLSF